MSIKIVWNFPRIIFINQKWPKETYGLVDQLKRAAVSVSLNIAEEAVEQKRF
jgi:four helix bundle protein